MRWGKDAQSLEAMAAAGHSVPALDARPSLTGYEWLYEAFVMLTTCRSMGMGAGPIPWTAIDRYADAEGLGEDDRYLLTAVILHMDKVYLDWVSEKQKQQSQRR